MSSAPTQIAVAPQAATTLPTANSAQIQKDFLEEPLARQNSFGSRTRGGLKGKHLTRSHAMKESTSPPRTPTPRSDHQIIATVATTSSSSSLSLSPSSDSSSDLITTTKTYVQSTMTSQSSGTSSTIVDSTPHVIITSQTVPQQQQQQSHSNVTIYSTNDTSPARTGVICNDVDFPKLTPPKSSKGNDHKTSPLPSATPFVSSATSTTATPTTTTESNNLYNGNKKNNANNNNVGNNNDNAKINGQQNSNRSHSSPTNRNSENFTSLTSSTTTITTAITSSSLHNTNNSASGNHAYTNNNLQQQQQTVNNSPPMTTQATITSSPSTYDKENRCPRNESQNSNNSGNYSQDENQTNNNSSISENDTSGKSDRLGKKHRNNANSKGSKPRLKNMSGSSSSMEGNSTSGFISRDSSTEQFTDQSGVDLLQFFKETLNKNPKDRTILVEIEKNLIELAQDKSKGEMRFPAMSSYNRMLIHRVAAFFGMDHNVDHATQQCVIVAPTKNTRIPEIRFKTLCRERMSDEPRKSILKRDVHSFDDCRQSYLSCPDRGMLDRKAKSFEEREEEYEKVKRKIFLNGEDEQQYWHYSNNGNGGGSGNNEQNRMRPNNKLLKVQPLPMDRHGGRPSVPKAHSFGGYGGPSQNGNNGELQRGDSMNSTKSSGPRLFKQDSVSSTNQSWRLSPSSSGYKTQTQSLRSDSVTPSPTGYGSDDHTPEPSPLVQSPPAAASCGVVWAVTDMASVPRGSVLINPQTLQPIVNQDGSIYHFDPSNLPPSQAVASGMYNNNNNKNNHKNIGVTTTVNRKKLDNNNRQQKTNYKQENNIINYNINTNNNNNINNNNNNNSLSSSSSTSTDTNSCGTITAQCISKSTSTSTNESSIETLSESSSSQTVIVNVNNNMNNSNCSQIDNNNDDIPIITKENNRDMEDIEEELVTSSYEENDKATLKIDHGQNIQQDKPKFINQATSPNIPSPEPDENVTQVLTATVSASTTPIIVTPGPASNEGIKTNNKYNTNDNQQTSNNLSTRSTPITANLELRKDENKSTSNIPIMSYATSYQTIDGTTVFQPAAGSPYTTTTYQHGPDGSVYAVPQQMLYAYPSQLDGEIQGYLFYDQGAANRDSGGLVATAPGQAIYQSATGGTTVVPVATYPTAAQFGGTPIYQQQVVYSPDQYTNGSAGAAAQIQQYPVTTYPVGYSYPCNGYWGQAMTYYVPQPPLANAVPSSIIPPPPLPLVSGTPGVTNGPSSLSNQSNGSTTGIIMHGGNSSGSGGKRSSPPQSHQHSHHHQHHHQQQQQQQSLSGQSSQSTTPANTTYQFTAGVPLAITSDPNGQPMYIPQSAVFPNMLPYGPPNAQSTPAGVLAHLPSQPNTVISPMISHPGVGPSGPSALHVPMEPPPQSLLQQHQTTTYTTTNGNVNNNNNGNRSGTPQSAPTTPLSNPLPAQHARNNPPLFATPPIISNGFNTLISNNPYQNYSESQAHNHSGNSNNVTYEKKNSYSSSKKLNSNNSGSSYTNNRQNNSYINQTNNRKIHENNSNSSIQNYTTNSGITASGASARQIYAGQAKRMNAEKPPNSSNSSSTSSNVNGGNGSVISSNIVSHNNNNSIPNAGTTTAQNNSDNKTRPGIRQKPGNLDFKRSVSQRNSPSTNSAESNNNSPNSIASNHNHMSGGSSSSGNNSTIGADHHHHHHHVQQFSHQQQSQHQSQTMYMTRGTHIPPMHQQNSAAAVVAAAAAAAAANDAACHQPLIGAYNHPAPSGMYFKYGQTYFAHPSVALPNNRRSPPNDIRPSLAPLYSTVNMMLPAPRQMQPRHPNPNYKGNKPSR